MAPQISKLEVIDMGSNNVIPLPLGVTVETRAEFTPVGATREASDAEQKAMAELMQACEGAFDCGAVVVIPAWNEIIKAPVEEIAMPDGEPLVVVLSRPLPEGQGLLITPDGKGGNTFRLARPQEEPDGQLSVAVPIDEERQQ